MKLSISRSHIEDIIEHAGRSFPCEACGILAGEGRRVLKVRRMTNAEKSAVNYSFPLNEHFEAQRNIRSEGMDIIGVYHSHPTTEAHPSLSDIKKAVCPEFFYLIVSLAGSAPEIRSFRIERGTVLEEAVDVI